MKKAVVFGLGYVGLPLASLLLKKGFEVVGVDPKKEAVERAENKRIHVLEDGLSAVKTADFIFVCVPTPVDTNYMPDLTALKDACTSISKGLGKGQLVIIESTVNPGVIEEVIVPILEQSGLSAGKDFFVAHCPERIDPGNKKWTLENIPRVVGGINRQSTKQAASLYRELLDSPIEELSSVRAAEATKIMENSFRDVNIAFVNEMAKSFDNLGIDILEVIRAASTKPFGFMAHYPGCGVGGHCIPVDPYYLIEEAKRRGFNHRFLLLAREINNSMPDYTVQKVIEGLNAIGRSVNGSHICVLGLAYKKDVNDVRESPSAKVIEKLRNLGANVGTFDPFLPSQSTLKTMDEVYERECLVLVTDHTVFRQMDYERLNNVKVIVDGRNCLEPEMIASRGIVYLGIGRGR